MIKPVECAVTGNATRIWKCGNGYWEFMSEKTDTLGFYMEWIRANTRLGAILRWNWRQWRSRRKLKGEATT